MESRTLWEQLNADPDDNDLWELFIKRYDKRVYTWAYRTLDGDVMQAKFITQDVFLNLYFLIKNATSKQSTRRSDTFAKFMYAIVMNVCKNHFREIKRQSKIAAIWLRIRSDENRRYFERLMSEAELAEDLQCEQKERKIAAEGLVHLGMAYIQAVKTIQLAPQSNNQDGKSWEKFLAAYSVEPYFGLGTKLDQQFGCAPGGSLKAAHRVAKSLFVEMGLPYQTDQTWKQSERILRELVKPHGDPSK